MKVLIAFASSHGTTEKAAHILAELLNSDVEIVDLHKNVNPNLSKYDSIIIGASIHAGTISRKEKQFIANNIEVLTSKIIGLFLCCMFEGEVAIEEFEQAFTKELRNHALVSGLFGGELLFSKMNFFEKQIVKKVSGTSGKEDISKLDFDVIKEFAEQFNAHISCGV